MNFPLMQCSILFSCSTLLLWSATSADKYRTECGLQPFQRYPRDSENNTIQQNHREGKIISGSATEEGQFPWQVSLELLHPSLGFIGHWCGGVLIDRFWILSAAHCVHNDLFNLPLPALWTVVLGEFDRDIESGFEQRIPVEKIVMHSRYHNFQHDLVLMKLSHPANISQFSLVRKICLPFKSTKPEELEEIDPIDDLDSFPFIHRDDNFLRKAKLLNISNAINMANVKINSILTNLKVKTNRKYQRRRNDKFFQERHIYHRESDLAYEYRKEGTKNFQELPYRNCIATGWGKSHIDSELTDILLQSNVPIHANTKCQQVYGSFVRIHRGHLCAGKLDGKGGTCVGDSGGPLQCRIGTNGPWILAGVTSFGSGCALKGFPDVYTRTSYYLKWITETIYKSRDKFYYK